MSKKLRETARLLEAADGQGPGLRLVQLISPGWGSSGYYSPAVLEAAVADQVIPAGTHMYADHPTDIELMERPERSIKDLVSTTTTEARLATDADIAAGAEPGALVAEVRVVTPYRDLIDDLADDIGVSILGSATDTSIGEADGRRGTIIEGLAFVQSVDWVTRAGRGGRALSVLESARAGRRAAGRGLREATVNDTRDGLAVALRDAYGGSERTWVWVRDFDDSTVWFEIESEGDENGIYGQPYTQSSSGAVELTGDRTEVRIVTTYVPATRPDEKKTTKESKEDTMPKIEIEESEHTRLVETAGRVDALVSENAALKEKDARRTRADRAHELVAERAKAAGVTFDVLQTRGLIAELPVTESGDLDETAFSAAVDKAASDLKEAQASGGDGNVVGFGGAPSGTPVAESGHRTSNPWGRSLTEASNQKGA
ncbi:hypothetical protein GUY44_07110 [Pimelobacter simplex]|uniref:Uncharacterized protein n=1 Tax=Nocardioides simplex TaxID=2045 RepID=A0A0A1DMA3_NOCSI|nr:hypothetical protein [Pimelobacter simplex]AIY17777.1 hypothetical protein KR76_15215 [Pimelobacter simplex]MCG8150241.1 hypothetical protein [Pimelobacter simplex]GEB13549.1 hypothetical protein NSI01_18640 [Pimelobacter simplex]SFM71845.1 hypothetical protein SAMN05421671_3122 [Pimelobacter simplex]